MGKEYNKIGCKYLIFGNGYLGNKFNNFLKDSIVSDVRINNALSVESEINKYSPDLVINCVGKTGKPNVDWCEDHKLETLESNVLVPVYIMQACQKLNKKMVHVGSGCVYEGDNNAEGFSEDDEPNFYGSFYSRTKILSEKILKDFNVLQIRIRMPVDSEPSPRNLLTKLLRYNKIINVKNSISVVGDVLRVTKELMDKNQTGIFNVVNNGTITHEELLNIYEEISGKKLNYEKISLEILDSMTKARRSNCVLSIKKVENLGITIPDVKSAVTKCIKTYVGNEKMGDKK